MIAAGAAGGAVAIELVDVRKHFGRTEVIRGASLSVKRGERFALIGPNGAGKSTLFDLISGRQSPSSGDIRLGGRSIVGLGPAVINHLGLARSFQITNLFARLSVYENLRCAALWSLGHRYSIWRRLARLTDVTERADWALEQVGLAARRDVEAGLLTYAEQRALEIGVAIAGQARVLLLDEPTAGMSRSETEEAIAMIRRVTEDRTLVMVDHDMSVVFGLADRIGVLVYGQVIACGTPEAVRADPQVQEAYLGTSDSAAPG